MDVRFKQALDLLNEFCQAYTDDRPSRFPALVEQSETLLQSMVYPPLEEGPQSQVFDIDGNF